MRALIICGKSPYPPVEGGSLAMYNMITGLISKGVTVKLLCISTPKFPVDTNGIPEDFLKQTAFEYVHINSNPNPISAIINLFNGKSYHVERFTNNEFIKAIEKILKDNTFEIIQLESLFVTQYIDHIRKFSNAYVVYRAHNIEHQIWERIAFNEKNFFKKYYLSLQASRLGRFERNITKKMDAIAAITATDAAFFKQYEPRGPIIIVPFGINLPERDYKDIEREIPSIFFLGSLNWIPNTEGLKWFLEHVWPAVNKQLPTLKFYIAGRKAPEWLLKLKLNNVIVLGEVDDALAYMHSKMIMVVPLFSGSGMRTKIIEGMFAANTVVSTTIGAEGIACTHSKDILIADTSNDFVNRIIECVNNPEYAQDIALQAQKNVWSHYMNDKIMCNVIQLYHDIRK